MDQVEPAELVEHNLPKVGPGCCQKGWVWVWVHKPQDKHFYELSYGSSTLTELYTHVTGAGNPKIFAVGPTYAGHTPQQGMGPHLHALEIQSSGNCRSDQLQVDVIHPVSVTILAASGAVCCCWGVVMEGQDQG